jgi:hypothetical protein
MQYIQFTCKVHTVYVQDIGVLWLPDCDNLDPEIHIRFMVRWAAKIFMFLFGWPNKTMDSLTRTKSIRLKSSLS